MKLLLDLGNTRLKWLALDGDRRLGEGAVAWSEAVAERLAEDWSGLPPPASVFGASVVDEAREASVEAQARAQGAAGVIWVRSPREACGVRSAYGEPQRLGVDRFLAMVAAHAQRLSPCVLVGVGTALTLDALAGDGRHLGGLIAPGPRLMQQSLLGATVRLHTEQTGVVAALADNTADAVVSGCWGACAGLVERFVADAAPLLGGSARLLFGGGDAAGLRALVRVSGESFVDGVLHGLAVWSATASPVVDDH